MPFDSENYQPTDDVLRALQDARQWLSDPARRTIGCEARDENGLECGSRSPIAIAWCAAGAASRVTPVAAVATRACNYLAAEIPDGADISLGEHHDALTHADVLRMFDRAIEARRVEVVEELTRAA